MGFESLPQWVPAIAVLVPTLVWVGRLQQTVTTLVDRDKESKEQLKELKRAADGALEQSATLKEKLADRSREIDVLKTDAGACSTKHALHDQRIESITKDIGTTKEDVRTDREAMNDMRVALEQQRSDIRSIADNMVALRDLMSRTEKSMRQMLATAITSRAHVRADEDTPPDGLPRTPRD